MKKIVIFFVIIIIILVLLFSCYANYKSKYNQLQKENYEYEQYYQKELEGANLATLINKAIDNNTKNNIEKDNKGKYIENEQNSIKIQIYMSDNDTTYDMETIYNGGIDKFVKNFNIIKFKCTKIEYHKNKKIKSLLFEQTQQ